MKTLSVIDSSDLRLGDRIIDVAHPELHEFCFTGVVTGLNLYDEFRNSMYVTVESGTMFSVDYRMDEDLHAETRITVER